MSTPSVKPTGKGYKFMNRWTTLMVEKALKAGITVDEEEVKQYVAKLEKLEAYKKELGL